MNMYMPVGSNALETAFQLAMTVNFCLAVSGSRGSVAAGGGGEEPSFPAWLRDFVAASLLSSQPMLRLQVPNATPCVAKDTNRTGRPRNAGVRSTLCAAKPVNYAMTLRFRFHFLPLPSKFMTHRRYREIALHYVEIDDTKYDRRWKQLSLLSNHWSAVERRLFFR